MPLTYADDVDIIGHNVREVSAAFSKFVEEANRLGLTVNDEKTKYLVSTKRESNRIGSHVAFENFNFEVVKDFIYLGVNINSVNDISKEITRRINLASRCYYGLNKQFSSKLLSRRSKITLYKTLILPVLMYGAETWAMSADDEMKLGAFERRILRKIFGPICVHGVWRIRWNHELYEMYDEAEVVQRIKVKRLRWLGHVVRMDEENPTRKVFESRYSGGRRRQGRPNLRWFDQVSANLKSLDESNCRQRAQDRSRWRGLMDEALTCRGL